MLLSRALRLPFTLFLCVALLLPGCAGMIGGVGDDPNDVCRPERAALRSTGDYFAKDIIQGAAMGAVAGGLIGLLAGGNARSAALGAVAGGALGAVGGYWRARQQQYGNQAQLYQAVYGDLRRENESIDQTQIAFNRLVACRDNQAARIRADYRAHLLTYSQAAAAMADVRAHADSDLELARSISGHIHQRSEDFSYADRQIQGSSSGGRSYTRRSRRAEPRASPEVREVQTATSTNLSKRNQFEQSIARAQTHQSAFELSS